MNETNALLTEEQREEFLSLLLDTMIGRAELSPIGWIVQDEPAEKRLHLEEFSLDTDRPGGCRYLLSLVVLDSAGQMVGCFPVTEELIWLRPAEFRSALLLVCNAPNSSVMASKPIHLAFPVTGKDHKEMEVTAEAQQVAFYVESMLRRKERLGVVVVESWDEAMRLIQTFRPWLVRLPTHWWERSRRNEILIRLFPGPGGLTLVFVASHIKLRLDRCLLPDSCLQLTRQVSPDLAVLLKTSRRTITPTDPLRVRDYKRNVTDVATPTLSSSS